MRNKSILTMLSAAALTAVAATSVPVTTAMAAPAKPEARQKYSNNAYIVQMTELPVVAYDGSIKGYKATKPRKGEKIDPNSPQVANYKSYLESRHDAMLASVGGGKKLHSYGYVFNGFAAELSAEQANKLAHVKGVLAVTKDSIAKMDTVTTPSFLGLNAPGGIWSELSGNPDGNPITARGPNSAGAGEGVVVGIIDSGIWPENPSFSDRDANGKLVFQQIPGWHGKCVPGEKFNASDCNQKLISARWYSAGFGGDGAIKGQFPYEFVSARAADGHGVHTASTAAGNYGVTAVADGINLGKISGIAPRARVAVYKTCWGIAPEGGCFNSDNVAAIDQAVADGVDVINYSISGTRTNFRDPVEIAFLFAADAGVFVAASAGNSGPTVSTVAHPSPWITTVAASTHDRFYEGTVTLGNGATYTGASLTGPVGPAPLVLSDDVGLASANPTEVSLCYPGTLDPTKAFGKIVVCDRGVIARVDKSLAVKQAGGVGTILVNVSASSINADLHYTPTVHLQNTDRAAVRAYAVTPGATASLSQGTPSVGAVNAPLMASFSSRGPLLAGNGDLLKPDITAPGVDVLAAYSPVEGGHDFEFLSGTSMSSPHVAGLAALMKDLHPSWSPMAIKSALMTTAYQTGKTGPSAGAVFGGPFDFGAGHADPNAAMNPGLVFDSNFGDWLGFLCGTQLPTSFCTGSGVPVLDPSDLNVPSIAIGDLAGTQTVTRRIKNVSGQRATFTVDTSAAPADMTISVTPSIVTLNPGASATLTIVIINVSAPVNAYRFGSIAWTSDLGHTARIPVVIQPVALAAPSEVSASGTSGSLDFQVTFGFDGAYSAGAHGLVPALKTPGNVLDDPTDTFAPFGPGTTLHRVMVPAGQAYARFSLFDDYTDGNDDLDLYVYFPNGSFAGGSGSGTSAEQVNLTSPPPGNYYVFVHGWQTDGPDANYTLFSWSFSATPGSTNMTVTAPTTATIGATGTIDVDWTGLDADTKYLGAVSHGTPSGVASLTVIAVDTD